LFYFKIVSQKKSIVILKNWYISNIKNPYASKLTKKELAKQTGLTIKQRALPDLYVFFGPLIKN